MKTYLLFLVSTAVVVHISAALKTREVCVPETKVDILQHEGPGSEEEREKAAEILEQHFCDENTAASFVELGCTDNNQGCPYWTGYCSWHSWVQATCLKTCGNCPATSLTSNAAGLGFSHCSGNFYDFLASTALENTNDKASDMYKTWLQPIMNSPTNPYDPGGFAIGDFTKAQLTTDGECAADRGMSSLLYADDVSSYSVVSIGVNGVPCGNVDLRDIEMGMAWTWRSGGGLLEAGSNNTIRHKVIASLASGTDSTSAAANAVATMAGAGFDVGVVINGDTIACVLDLVQTGTALEKLLAIVVDMGLDAFAMGFSVPGEVSLGDVEIFTPGGWTSYNAKAHWYGYIAFEPEIPLIGEKGNELISFNVAHYRLVNLGNLGNAAEQTLDCLVGLGNGNGCNADFLDIIKELEQTMQLTGTVTFNLEDATNGLLPDISAELAKASVLMTAGSGSSGQGAGFYAMFEMDVMATIAQLAKDLCSNFEGILNLFGASCPTGNPSGGSSKLGLYVNDNGIGLSINTDLFDVECKLKWSPLDLDCDFKINMLDVLFKVLHAAGEFIVKGLTEIGGAAGEEIAKIADDITGFASDAVAGSLNWAGGAAEDAVGAVGDAAHAVGDFAEDAAGEVADFFHTPHGHHPHIHGPGF